jgi:ribose transport system permease protein
MGLRGLAAAGGLRHDAPKGCGFSGMKAFVERYGTAVAGTLIVLFFLLFARNFANPQNLINIAKDTSVLAILAIAFMLALRVAELDLSVAEIASLAAVTAGFLIQNKYDPSLAVLAGLGVGAGLGLFNGFCVTSLKVPSLIATLGTAAMAKGLAFAITQGVSFVGRWPVEFTGLARGALLGVPNLIWFFLAVAFGAWFLLAQTRLGAHMAATGEAAEAARLAGIRTRRIKRIGLCLSGLLAGLAAVLLAANVSSAAPNMAGDYFLYSIAAVLLGMTMFQPGTPNVAGTVFAAIVLKALGNGLVLLGAAYYVQDIVLGIIIIGSVAFSASVLKKAAFTV